MKNTPVWSIYLRAQNGQIYSQKADWWFLELGEDNLLMDVGFL